MFGGATRRSKDAEQTAVPVTQSPDWAAEEPRWMRDQRTRRRRLSRRGRATLASAMFVSVVVLGWVVDPFSPVRAASQSETPPVSAGAPPVGDAPPETAPDSPAPGAVPLFVLERLPLTRKALSLPITGADGLPASAPGHLFERVPALNEQDRAYTVEYTLDAQLTQQVFEVLENGRVGLGNVILMDPNQGRVLAYASTDLERFPPTRSYPAASLVKVITAATVLDRAPEAARAPCRFLGSPYRLTASRIDPPRRRGNVVTLERALATSNNQCFAQLAVHAVGVEPLLDALGRFGWLSVPAPAHAAGEANPGVGRLDTGRLGCGLAGCRITPLHAAQLAASLVRGELVAPHWIERVWDPDGRELVLPATPPGREILSPALTEELRGMLIETTRSGTARRAFHKRGRPLLGDVTVAGKTGSLSGKNPDGRYEWFIGVAPAEAPRVVIATVVVQTPRYWRTASQVAAGVLESVFCERGRCDASRADRFTAPVAPETVARVIPLRQSR